MSWFVNYPKDLGPVWDSQILPKNKVDKDKGYPAYVWQPRVGSSVSMMLSGGVIPGLAKIANEIYGPFNRQRQLECHPLEQFIDECAAEWDNYGRMFKEQGCEVEPPPYPYTYDYVRELCERNDREGEEDMIKQQQRMMGQ